MMKTQNLLNKSINKSLELFLSFYTQLKSGKRKKCLVYGNCQSDVLSRILCASPEFSQNYEIIKFKPVFKLEKADLENLKIICQETDLFIYQPVRSGYRGLEELGTNYLKSLLKPQSRSISFHSLYFSSYNPEMIYISKPNAIDNDRVFVGPFGDYHNKNIIDMFIRGCQVKDVVEFLNDPEALDLLSIQGNLESSITELERREYEFDLDIKIANYIRNNYQLKRLFWTKNHPANYILFHCVYSIQIFQDFYNRRIALNFPCNLLLGIKLSSAIIFKFHVYRFLMVIIKKFRSSITKVYS